jgi:hypothetical protein
MFGMALAAHIISDPDVVRRLSRGQGQTIFGILLLLIT